MSNQLASKVASGLVWSAIRSWGSRLAGLAVFFALARLLSPVEFGIFAAAAAVLAFMELFVDQGLGDALVQRKTVSNELINTVFVINLIFSVLVVIILIVAAPYIAEWMKMPALREILMVSSLGIVFNAMGMCQQAMYRREMQYKWLAIRSLVATFGSGILGVGAALLGFGVWSLVIQFIAMCVLNLIMIWRTPLWRPSREFDRTEAKNLSKYGFNILSIRLLDFSNTRLIDFVIGALMGPVALGVYSVGSRIYMILMQLLSSVVLDVAHVGFSKIADDREKMKAAYYRATRITAAFAVPILVSISAMAPVICVLVFGAQWKDSAAILAPLSLLGAIQVLQYFNGSCLNAMGRPDISLRIVIMKAVVSVLVLIFFNHLPLEQMVQIFVAAQLLVTPVSFYFGQRFVGFAYGKLIKSLFLPFCFSLFLYLGLHASSLYFSASSSLLLVALVQVCFAVCIYGIYVFFIDKNFLHELQNFKKSFQ